MKKLNLILVLVYAISASGFSQTDSLSIQLNDSIKLDLVREVFHKEKHSIKFLNDTDLLIDNKIVFGTDGEMPKYYLKSAEISIKGQVIKLETQSIYNPWFRAKPNKNRYGMILDGTRLKVRGLFSDGAGSFGAEWLVLGEGSVRTILTYDEQILFEYLKY